MPIRSSVRLAVGVLAAFAAGCGSSRQFQPVPAVVARAADKNSPAAFDNRTAASSWTGATPAARATWPDPVRPTAGDELAAGQPVGDPLSMPRPAGPTPAYYGGGYPPSAPPPPPDATARRNPTVSGEWMNLAPHETPMDRAVEFARKIEQMGAENKALVARIYQLEAAAEAREVALNETLRDVRLASEEVIRTRAEMQAVRKELAALKVRVVQMEKDDTERLKALIAAIEKMLAQNAPPSASEKK